MNNEKKNKIRIAIVAFSMNFVVGNLAMLIGSSLPYLADFYQYPSATVVLMGSFFAAGRVASSFLIGKASEKFGPIRTLKVGVISMVAALLLIPVLNSLYVGYVLTFIMGIGFSCNDAITPLLYANVFPKHYASVLSLGQALYGGGGFLIAFLIGNCVKLSLPYFLPYHLLALFLLVLFYLMMITKFTPSESFDGENSIKPLYSKNKTLSFVLLALASLTYCAVCCCVGLYTTSYCIDMGIDEVTSNFILSIFNIGCSVGSIVFVPVLNKISEKKVMIINTAAAVVAFALAMYLHEKTAMMILVFLGGFFLGVLFSVLLSMTTRIGYEHIATSSALVGTAGGVGDILAPLVTAEILKHFGISTTYQSIIVLLILTLLFAIGNDILLKKEK